ncbi:hypothetical protein [Actinoalloteichus sp. GBA129-24]|uniref:hypothetical protein n=1 Tax=Actinoalloteichus sp. GBA129-24 TaxID=1612551 RepID=UPI0009505995|nr:hypothetical protein [Actinoalloteichus sp. GBA129-24]APU20929.1 hypothetical protein UA75_14595 [Actinoalloteichus sp. GBA129-24]APU24178.1 hypothetical protein UA75_31075 [Actinoalloteichus sp. GBA129-24]
MIDIVAAIDGALADERAAELQLDQCATCSRRLRGDASYYWCSDTCQERWHAARSEGEAEGGGLGGELRDWLSARRAGRPPDPDPMPDYRPRWMGAAVNMAWVDEMPIWQAPRRIDYLVTERGAHRRRWSEPLAAAPTSWRIDELRRFVDRAELTPVELARTRAAIQRLTPTPVDNGWTAGDEIVIAPNPDDHVLAETWNRLYDSLVYLAEFNGLSLVRVTSYEQLSVPQGTQVKMSALLGTGHNRPFGFTGDTRPRH